MNMKRFEPLPVRSETYDFTDGGQFSLEFTTGGSVILEMVDAYHKLKVMLPRDVLLGYAIQNLMMLQGGEEDGE